MYPRLNLSNPLTIVLTIDHWNAVKMPIYDMLYVILDILQITRIYNALYKSVSVMGCTLNSCECFL